MGNYRIVIKKSAAKEIEKIQKRIAEKHGYKLVDSKLELYCIKK